VFNCSSNNDIIYNIVRGKRTKKDVYGQGLASKNFKHFSSTSSLNVIISDEYEEMENFVSNLYKQNKNLKT